MAFYFFQYIPLPLFPLYNVNELHLSDGAISLGNGLFYGMMMLTSLWMTRLIARIGYRGTLVLGTILFAHYPLILGLAHDATLFWVASITGGIVWAILNSGLINRLMERVPENDRPAHMALHNLVLNLSILAGSLVGPILGNWLGLREALFVSVGLRLVGGVLVWIWG